MFGGLGSSTCFQEDFNGAFSGVSDKLLQEKLYGIFLTEVSREFIALQRVSVGLQVFQGTFSGKSDALRK